MKHLFSEFRKISDRTLSFDVADFTSDQIEIIETKNKGKGVIAKNDIKRGTLLCGSKAASIAFGGTLRCRLLSVYYNSDRKDTHARSHNITNMFYKIQNNPYMAKEFYKLYSGTSHNRDEAVEDFLVDPFLVDSILMHNSYVTYDKNIMPMELAYENISGIWIMPSYFNHSCLPNAFKLVLNDFFMIYASKDIKKGEDITIRYFSEGSYFRRKTELLKEYDITCDCRLCELDRNDPNTEERDNLIIKEGPKLIRSIGDFRKQVSVKEPTKLLEKVNFLYSNRSEFKTGLENPLMILAQSYYFVNNFKKSAEHNIILFDLCKDWNEGLALHSLMEAINSFLSINENENAKKCYKLAKEFTVFGPEYFKHVCNLKIDKYELKKKLLED